MMRQSVFADTAAVVGVVGSAAAGMHYDGIWGGVAGLWAAVLIFALLHWLAMIQAALTKR